MKGSEDYGGSRFSGLSSQRCTSQVSRSHGFSGKTLIKKTTEAAFNLLCHLCSYYLMVGLFFILICPTAKGDEDIFPVSREIPWLSQAVLNVQLADPSLPFSLLQVSQGDKRQPTSPYDLLLSTCCLCATTATYLHASRVRI